MMKGSNIRTGKDGGFSGKGSADKILRDKLLHLAFSCDLVLDSHAANLDPDLRLSLSCMIDRLLYEAERWPTPGAAMG